MKNNKLKSLLAGMLALVMLCGMIVLPAPGAHAEEIKTYGDNLVFNNGTMDGILGENETERTLNNDWAASYPVATFGGPNADSPAKIKNIDGNNVLVLEYTTGGFASYFADLYADGTTLPEGTYRLSMDLKPLGDFATDNVGYTLYNQYTDIRIYDNGWQNCTELENGWLRYEREFEIEEGKVDSIQMWFNTMSSSTLYIDNLSLCAVTVQKATNNLVFNGGSMDGILGENETERTLNNDWAASYPVATFGGPNADSPAKIKNIDGNNVLVLEYTTGSFASYFADLYADGTTLPAGTYELSMDLKPLDGFTTDNVGYTLFNQYTDIRIYDNGWKDCTELENGWLHYSKVFEIEEGKVDSIQMWFNTMGSSTLYIDNLSIALLEAEPEREELNAEYVAGSGAALNIAIPNAAETITVAEKAGYVLEEGLDYTYANGTLTLMNEYADGLASGKNDLIITAGNVEYKLRLIIRQSKPALPGSSEGYLMQETLVGGDFEMFEEGFAFSLEQVEGWGSNISYDDPGVIVNQNGNKVLRLQKDQKSSYSSAFAFISPTIQAGDVLTFKFDYKLDVQDISIYQGADINLSFVSASNMQMLKIALDNSCPAETTGDGDYQWAVNYTTLEDGWIRVELTFVANTALLSYNSMRFLLPTDKALEGDAMYVDNVSLVLWAEPKAPETISTDLVFNKAKPADIYAMVDLQALDPQNITLNGAVVDAKYWTINPAKDTFTFSKDYLATLENGEHTFTITTAGGSCELAITVTGEAAAADQGGDNGGEQQTENSKAWIWIVVAVVVVAALAAAVIISKKKIK